jgi:hypothetical protein
VIQVFSDSKLNRIFPSGVLYSSWLAPVEFRYSVWNVFGAACQKWKNRKGFFWRSCKRPCSFGPRHTLRHAKRIITHTLNIEIQAPFKLDRCSMLFLLLPRAPTVLARDRAVHNMLRLRLFFPGLWARHLVSRQRVSKDFAKFAQPGVTSPSSTHSLARGASPLGTSLPSSPHAWREGLHFLAKFKRSAFFR